MTPIIYPLDLTGRALTNKLRDQTYHITQLGGDDYFQFRFKNGPVYRDGLVLIHSATNRELRPNIDYQLSYPVRALIPYLTDENKDNMAYACCIILNKKLSGSIIGTYQLVGGDFSDLNTNFIPSAVNNLPQHQLVYYDDVVNIPETFIPTTHTVSTAELTTGFDDMVTVLWAINDSIRALEPSGKFTIDNIIGLQEELDFKVDYRLNAKVQLVSKHASTNNTLKSQIKVSFPKAIDSSNLISTTIVVSSDYEFFRVHVRGVVSRTGVKGTPWYNPIVRVEGTNNPPPIYLTFTPQNEPTIYIGTSQTDVGKIHVNVTDYTTNTAQPHLQTTGFKIYFTTDDLTGLTATTPGTDNGHKHRPEDTDAADRFGVVNLQKKITVAGDANTYYPVKISNLSLGGFGVHPLNIYRPYNAPAPGNIWNAGQPTYPGGLTLGLFWNGDGFWGGNGGGLVSNVAEFAETYSTMLTKITPCIGGMVVWLRGGGADYWLNSDIGEKLIVEVFLAGFTDTDASRSYMPMAYNAADKQAIIDSVLYSKRNPMPLPITATRWPAWEEVTNKPATMPPGPHGHPWSDLSGVPVYAVRWPTTAEINAVNWDAVSSASGYDGLINKLPIIQGNGVMEIAKYIDFHDAGTWTDYSARLTVSGDMVNFSGPITANDVISRYSDGRLKNIKGTLDPKQCYEAVLRWKKVRYTANEIAMRLGQFDPTEIEIGLIAEDFSQEFPELTPLAPFDRDYEGDQHASKSKQHYRTLRYDRITAILSAAFEYQATLMEQQSERLAKIEKHLNLEE